MKAAALALVVAGVAQAQPETLPERPPAPVVDQAGALPDEDERALVARILAVERKTGHQIGVAVVRSLGGLTVEEYAVRLFQRWGVGRKGEDDGVLVLLATGERKIRIEVGYGLEGVLPDGKVGAILDRALPALKQNDWPEGVRIVVEEVTRVLLDEPGAVAAEPAGGGDGGGLAGLLPLLAGAILALLLAMQAAARTFPGTATKLIGAGLIGGASIAALAMGAGAFGLLMGAVAAMVNVAIGSTLLRHRCPRCQSWVSFHPRVLVPATAARNGAREVVARCTGCQYRKVWTEIIPRLGTTTSSGGWHGGGGRFGGGGFGGFGGGRSGGGGASRSF